MKPSGWNSWNAARRCSRTVSRGNTRAAWKVRPRPRRAATWGGRPVMSRPSSAIRPRSGLTAPAMQLKSVVLPDPFGPMIPTSSPAPTVRSMSASAVTPAKRLVSPATSRTGGGHVALRGAAPPRR